MKPTQAPQFEVKFLELLEEFDIPTYAFTALLSPEPGRDSRDMVFYANIEHDGPAPATQVSNRMVEGTVQSMFELLRRENGLSIPSSVGVLKEAAVAGGVHVSRMRAQQRQLAAQHRAAQEYDES